ncbi:Vacuolar protein sorting-associated protein atg6 [Thecaphora frezii]
MSFTCQKCRQPLWLAPSISSELDLNQSAYDLIQDSFIAHRPPLHALDAAATLPLGLPDDDAAATATAKDAQATLSARLLASSRLFDLLSHPPLASDARGHDTGTRVGAGGGAGAGAGAAVTTTIDHPLCKQCTDTLLEMMDDEMASIRKQRDALLAFEAECRRYGALPRTSSQLDGASEADVEAAEQLRRKQQEVEQQLQSEIDRLEAEESEAERELRDAETRRIALEEDIEAIEREEEALRQEEERFWSTYSSHAREIASLSSVRSSLLTSLDHTRAALARLTLTNVYNDAFCIGHDGGFATINGLRLGRLPGANVEWNEINAAWGQTALLLSTLARKLDVRFQGWTIVPKGSFSTVHRTDGDKAVYELYGSGDWQIGRLLQSRRFDHAMVGFLECLRQLASWASERDESLRLPHTINKDRIGEASIRLQFGQDETWTRALRHVLWTLKVLLSWTVQRLDEADGSLATATATPAGDTTRKP